jgi:hypothetical protein
LLQLDILINFTYYFVYWKYGKRKNDNILCIIGCRQIQIDSPLQKSGFPEDLASRDIIIISMYDTFIYYIIIYSFLWH